MPDSVVVVLLVALLTIAGFLYRYFTSTFSYWSDRGVCYITPLPIFGNVKEVMLMRTSVAEGYQNLYNSFQGQPFAGIFQTRQPTLMVRDPNLVRTILTQDFTYFSSRGLPYDMRKDPLSAHLLNLDGQAWKEMRSHLSPAFSVARVKNMVDRMAECAQQLVASLKTQVEAGGGSFDLEAKEAAARYTTDVLGTCAFGLRFDSLRDPNSQFRNIGRRVFQPSAKATLRRFARLLLPAFIFKYLKVQTIPEDVSQFFLMIVRQGMDYREENPGFSKDFLQQLVELRRKGKEAEKNKVKTEEDGKTEGADEQENHLELSDGVIAAQALSFFLAGFETSAGTLAFCLLELAVNPDIQSKARREVFNATNSHGGISYEALQKMKYLDAILSETLRKYPPAANLVRAVTKPYTIPGTDVRLDTGVRVVVPVFAIQRDEQYFHDPDVFQPERFLEERQHKAFMPFGDGPRVCIGRPFGLLQAKTALAALLSQFEFQRSTQTQYPVIFNPRGLVTAPLHGAWVTVRIL